MAFAPKSSKPRVPGIITQAEKPRTTQKAEPSTRPRRVPSVSEAGSMRNARPKSVEASVGAEMGARRVAMSDAAPKRAKARSPARKPVATRPVVEGVHPTVKKKNVTVIRDDPTPKTKAKPIVVAPDVLSLSAQLAPWIYMSSTLETALQGSETRLNETLEERNLELDKEETRFKDARIRATKAAQIAILGELGFGEFSSSVCDIFCRSRVLLDRFKHFSGTVLPFLQQHMAHEEDWDPGQYATIIGDLDHWLADSLQLQTDIRAVVGTAGRRTSLTPESRVLSALSDCNRLLETRASLLQRTRTATLKTKDFQRKKIQLQTFTSAANRIIQTPDQSDMDT